MLSKGHDPVFFALATVYAEHCALEVRVKDGEVAKLFEAYPRGIEHFENGPVGMPVGFPRFGWSRTTLASAAVRTHRGRRTSGRGSRMNSAGLTKMTFVFSKNSKKRFKDRILTVMVFGS